MQIDTAAISRCFGKNFTSRNQTLNDAGDYATDGKNYAYLYAGGIVVCAILSFYINHPFLMYMGQLGVRLRLTLCSMLYRKVRLQNNISLTDTR